MKVTLLKVAALLALSTFGAHGFADESKSFEGAAKDAWLTGKVETVFMLNRHLNAFSIDTDVDNGMVHLTGAVESDIDRDLAGELAKNIDGVSDVKNDLQVAGEQARVAADTDVQKRADGRTFGTWVDDATTTASVKSRLLGNSNTKGLQIDVDTAGDVVTLSGSVSSNEEKNLAEEIARSTGDVDDVRNNLVVDAQ